MSDTATKSHPRRAVEVLTRQNHERWFRLMKQWLIGEGLWLVVDPENAPDPPATPASTPSSSVTGITEVTQPESYGRDLTALGLTRTEAPKLDARAQYQIVNCIDEDDEEMIAEETRARGIWINLLKKYKKNLKTVGRQYLVDLINYKKPADMNIESAYTEITKMSRKVAELQPDMKAVALPARRFQTLLKSLPEEYETLRDAIDAQTDPDIDVSLQKLQEKEAQLQAKDKEMAMWAKDNNRKDGYDYRQCSAYRIPQRRRSASSNCSDRHSVRNRREDSVKSEPKDRGCFLCDGRHRIKDYELLRKLRKLAKTFTRKDIKLGKQKQKAYNANDNTSSASSSAESLDINSDNEEDMEEIAALSKELVSTVPKSDWIADTGATSHMTDQLRLFSEPLKSIKKRTIKVGGGRLYSD